MTFLTLIFNAIKVHSVLQILKHLNGFLLTTEMLDKMKEAICKSMDDGANGRKSCLEMINTHVNILPSKTIKGQALSLDLGSSNFRILHIKDDGQYEENVKYYDVPEDIKKGTSKKVVWSISVHCN